jgi:hypothetical protein
MTRKIALFVCAVIWLCESFAMAQGSGPKLAVLDQAGWQVITSRGNFLSIQLDLLLLRANPSLLDDPSLMRYFIMLNQCGASGAQQMSAMRSLHSEFDYPAMAASYKASAADIVKVAPDRFTLAMAAPYDQSGHYHLGEWDPARKAFPFVDLYKKPTTVKFDNVTPGGDRSCTRGIQPDSPPVYRVMFPEQKFTEIPMTEEAARAYVAKHGQGRPVSAIVEVQVLPDPPQTWKKDPRTGDKELYVTFQGKVTKVSIITDDSFRQLLGVVYP